MVTFQFIEILDNSGTWTSVVSGGSSYNNNDYFEKGLELAINNGLMIKPIDISNFMCIEIDFIDDLKRLRDK